MCDTNQNMNCQEANLKKVIGFWDALAYAIGLTIGGGVMALTGIGIGLTGVSVVLAFVVGALIVCVLAVPLTILGSALPTTAGTYRYITRLLSPKLAGFYLFALVAGQITISTFGISFTQYLQALIPDIPLKLVAVLFMVTIYILNMFGLKIASKFQNVFVFVLLIALGLFIGFGIPNINMEVLKAEPFFHGGLKNFFSASALLAFALLGATGVTDIGGELKNPKRDIPLVIVLGTGVILLLYVLMGIVAVGVLPYDQVANQPLSFVAKAIFPKGLFEFFIVGGALLAIATSLHGYFAWVPKPFIIACDDGLIPKWIGQVNEKTGAPVVLNTIILFVGIVPIIFDVPLETVGRIGPGILIFVNIFTAFAMAQLPKKYPEEYNKSYLKLSPGWLNFFCGLSVITIIGHAYFSFSGMPLSGFLMMGIYIVIATICSYRAGSKVRFKREF